MHYDVTESLLQGRGSRSVNVVLSYRTTHLLGRRCYMHSGHCRIVESLLLG